MDSECGAARYITRSFMAIERRSPGSVISAVVPVAVCHFPGKTERSGEYQPVKKQDGSNRWVEQYGLLSVSEQGVEAANDDHVQHDEDEQDAVVVKEIPSNDKHQAEIEHEDARFHGAAETI